MRQAGLKQKVYTTKSSEYCQCKILWRNLPAIFKTRWRNEAEDMPISGYKLFISTNIDNLRTGNEIQIAPWH